jgi:AraC family transcriptional regulator
MNAQSTPPNYQQNTFSSSPYNRITDKSFRLSILSDPPGEVEVPSLRNTIVSIHVGPSSLISCRRGGSNFRGTAVHGDIDIIPARTPSLWELKEKDTALVLSVAPELLAIAAEELDFDPSRIEIRNRFQARDMQLENIGWTLKAEMECGYPCGRLYRDSLAMSVAARLVNMHSSVSAAPEKAAARMPGRKLKEALAYIEDNLSHDISLHDLAAVTGLSVSHFKNLFRESVGLPAHQYLIRRRVDRAKSLLGEGKLSISQIALEAGFAHQSHLAHHMRRVLGVSPKKLQAMLR